MKGSGLTEDRKKARRDGRRWGRPTGDLNSEQGNQEEEEKRRGGELRCSCLRGLIYFYFFLTT